MDNPDGPRELIREIWAEMFRRSQVSNGPDGKLAVAKEAHALMKSFTELEPKHRNALAAVEGFRAMGGGVNYDPETVAAAATAAINSHPVLAKFQAERDKANQERAAEIEAAWQSAEAQRLRDLPRDMLRRLRERGLVIGLSPDGKHITALPRDHGLSPSEIDTMKERLPDFLALLKAEAAAAPVVIA